MQTYGEYRPTGFDIAGLGLSERQDWLVAIGVNRDSDTLDRSNWEFITRDLFKQQDPNDENEVEIHRFGHWACGWINICLVKPGTKAAKVAQEWENALADYPVADENHYLDLQYREACEYWEHASLREKVELCQRSKVSIFAARRELPDGCFQTLCDES